MKFRNLIWLLTTAILIASCAENKFESKHEPFDHFFFQRAFPDSILDYAAMDQSLKRAKRFANQDAAKSDDAEWMINGPYNIGGRINCVAIHPENDDVWLSGTAGGGVYRTTDAGESWEPITNEISHLPISDIVFDPTNSQTIYVGTGDPNVPGTVWIGGGVFKSTDGGENFEYIGLEECRIISKIVVNPNNPDQIFAGAMGVPFVESEDRGLYRSNDGGQSWTKIFSVSEASGITDMVMNPSNPEEIYVANWNRIRTVFESVVSGDEGGIFKTSDGGENWTELTNGLPTGPVGRIGLKLWDVDPSKVYALYVGVDSQLQGIFKSNDSGASFSEIPTDGIGENALGGFGWYFAKLGLSPFDEDEISVLGVDMYSTTDGGATWFQSVPDWWTYEVHADKHDMEYIGDGDILLATDGGLYRTTTGLEPFSLGWQDVDEIPNTQFYRIATDPFTGSVYYGGAQDNGTSGPDENPDDPWIRIFGGDGFTPIPDPVNPNIFYCTTQRGNFYAIDYEFFDFINLTDQGIDPDDRSNWDSPFIMSHFDNTVLYAATERVYRMDFAPYGTFLPISPSLVDDVDNNSNRTISTLTQSPIEENVLYAGTSDGLVWVHQPDTEEWENISDGLPNYYVTDIKGSSTAAGTVFVCLSGYRLNDNTSHLYRSTDFGSTWEPVTGDLPAMPINHFEEYAPGIWFIATDNGVYLTENGGDNWSRVGANMPYIVVSDLAIDHIDNRLVAGTFAQSIWSVPLSEVLTNPDNTNEGAELDFLVYPNPARDHIKLEGLDDSNQYAIHDLSGKMVGAGKLGSDQDQISLPELPSGVYLITVLKDGVKLGSKKIKVID